MLTIIKSLFEKTIYRNEFFRIVRVSENKWHVKARNSLAGTLVFSESIVYISVSDTPDNITKKDSVIARYAVLKKDTDVCVDDFIVSTVKASLIFYIDSSDVSYFLGKENTTFGVRNTQNQHVYKTDINLRKINISRFEGLLFEQDIYSLVELNSKKIINSVFHFSFNCVTIPSKNTQFKTYYIIGKKLFSLNNMTMFKESTLNYVKGENAFNPVGFQYGIQNQLENKFDELEKKIELDNISILMHRNQYCLLQKNKDTISLSYLADFKYDNSKIPKEEIYTIEQKNSIVIKRNCKAGSIRAKSENFSLQMAKEHEMSIFESINVRRDRLKHTHPSRQVLQTLKKLGLSTETPILEESFKVIEFFEI